MIEVFADVLDTAALAEATAVGQRIKLLQPRTVLAVKVALWLQDPDFAGLRASIWSVSAAGNPAVKIAESDNEWSRPKVLSQMNHGLKEVYFEFQSPVGIPLAAGEYVLRLHATSYVYSADSHIAWKKAYPYPAYPANLPSVSEANMPSFPREVVLIGADFEL